MAEKKPTPTTRLKAERIQGKLKSERVQSQLRPERIGSKLKSERVQTRLKPERVQTRLRPERIQARRFHPLFRNRPFGSPFPPRPSRRAALQLLPLPGPASADLHQRRSHRSAREMTCSPRSSCRVSSRPSSRHR